MQRRAPQAHDVDIEILYCGVCHSDVHTARSEWGGTVYPCVPGHEIIGRVTAVGGAVTRFKAGQTVGVGCLVDACRQCGACDDGLEQYCERGFTGTYNGKDKHLGGVTFGGYSTRIVVDENFVLRVPDNLDPAAAAPLLCAGITLYSPLRHWKVVPGMSVGIVGLGGSATWASSWPMRWVPRSPCSPPPRQGRRCAATGRRRGGGVHRCHADEGSGQAL